MKLLARLAALLPVAVAHPTAVADIPPAPPPPGTVIHHSPAALGLYIGSPSLCVLPDGSYLASHDLFGPNSNEHVRATGRVYQSRDRGATWDHLTDLDGFFWTKLFVHRGAVFALGTDRHHGRLVIRRSADGGRTWTTPETTTNGVLDAGQWHMAPQPLVEHAGRLWRAVEDAMGGTKWGHRYRARMLSAPLDADLLRADSWTISNPLARDPAWLEGKFGGWLEGNAVAAPDGGIVNLLRVDAPALPERAAIVRVSADGRTATFDPSNDFVEFPGGAKKFTIRKDPAGPGYWSLASIVAGPAAGHPASIRNTLALVHSPDLRRWEVRCVLLHHPDRARHGFQYVDWLFDGGDLIAACRTAWDDAGGGARNNHDANFLTFHRWRNFRALTRADDVPVLALGVTPPEASVAGPQIVAEAFDKLSKELADALAQGGAAAALPVCSEKAPRIAAEVGKAHGVALRRATAKPRNPRNAADAAESQVLLDFAAALARKEKPVPRTVANADGSVTFFAPIVLGNALCLQCHGAPGQDIAPATLAAIRENYPEDRATGFKLGDLRGLWRVTFPARR